MSALAKALVAAQAEFPTIERSKDVRVQTKTGGSYSFSYAPLDVIFNAVRPVLTRNGLAVSQLLGNVDGKPALKTVLLHEDGEKLEDACPLPANGSLSAQEFGSLVTYFRRYALVTVLGIATEEDDDGNAASGNRSGAEPATADSTAPGNPAEEAYQAAVAARRLDGALPSDQVIHFGKNKGVKLGDLTPAQLRWYAIEWKLQDEPSEYDHRIKRAAIALNAGHNNPNFDDDVPFE